METQAITNLKALLKNDPLWYRDDEIRKFIELFKKEKLTRSDRSRKHHIKELLKTTDFVIGETGYNWDQWRLPIECVVIHHTSSSPTISLNELNILGLRLYINQYLKDEDVKGQPLYSGHYWYGKSQLKENMCFVSYHYLVRPSGRITQLVDDKAYLWHAANLDINRRSIAIALTGKYIDREPTDEAINSVKYVLNKHNIPENKVYGHCEVADTLCPGNTFINGWKNRITTHS
ncbi:MAG: peptidoglycan recognition family protein [Patescibacteria group bacterium]|jgi:hypothetical protein